MLEILARHLGTAAPHLIVAPILLPLLTAIVLLLMRDRRRWHIALNVGSSVAGLLVAVLLMYAVRRSAAPAALGVYLPSNWDVPFGIVLVVDRLSAMMLLLTSCVGLASLLFAIARWDRAGVHFHPLFQLQLMGLNGVFLTGDLFNLFVFFEVMLAASYGLLLHGSGRARVGAGLHYLVLNLVASSLFLIGVALLYGVTGTLNLAHMAQRIAQVDPADRGLLQAGAAILAVAFLTKAAAWPLNFWLVPAYSAASAPVAALFSIMTKVGVYSVLRLWSLLFPETATGRAPFGGEWLLVAGLATLAFGAMGMLTSQKVDRLAALAVTVSSGSLLAALSFGQTSLTGGALFYLLSSTLALAALFLLAELVERSRLTEGAPAHAEARGLGFPVESLEPARGSAGSVDGEDVDDDDEQLTGRPIPAAMAFLGMSFIACTLLVAGMPPLAGFVGKLAMLSALLEPLGSDPAGPGAAGPSAAAWTLLALLVLSGLLSLVAMTGAGVRYFWTPSDRPAPRLRLIECLPIAGLLLGSVLLTVRADSVLRYTQTTARMLQTPSLYIDAVMAAWPVPGPKERAR